MGGAPTTRAKTTTKKKNAKSQTTTKRKRTTTKKRTRTRNGTRSPQRPHGRVRHGARRRSARRLGRALRRAVRLPRGNARERGAGPAERPHVVRQQEHAARPRRVVSARQRIHPALRPPRHRAGAASRREGRRRVF